MDEIKGGRDRDRTCDVRRVNARLTQNHTEKLLGEVINDNIPGTHPLRAEWEATFWERVETGEDNACWNWSGPRNPEGYGVTTVPVLPDGSRDRSSARVQRAYRVAYLLRAGLTETSLEVGHLCGNRACCNPRHLREMTHAENMAMRPYYERGSNKIAVSTAELVSERAAGASVVSLARKYGVTRQAIHARLKRAA